MHDPEFPATIRAGQLALAAGQAGRPMALVYRGFAATLMAQVWQFHAREVGEEKVIYVLSRRHLRQLVPGRARPDDKVSPPTTPCLALVPDTRLLADIAWAAELGHRGAAKEAGVGTTVFAIAGTDDDDDAPGPRLDLYATPEEERAIVAWLRGGAKGKTRQPTGETAVMVAFPEPIEQLCWPPPPGSDTGLARLRDCQVLRALLAGASVLNQWERLNNTSATKIGAPSETPARVLEVTAQDYESVYHLLRNRLARPADEPVDPLAAAMVARANESLKMAAHRATTRKAARTDGEDEDGVYRPRQVTRGELLDLGKPHSRVNLQLLTFLLDQEDGLARLLKIGLVRRLPKTTGWPGTNTAKDLAPLLQSWSYRQIRSHFERLQRQGVIGAERPTSNGPWCYTLPEDLAAGKSAFHGLPHPAVVRAELAAAAAESEAKPACPGCPPVAQPAGQAEVQQ